MAGKKAGSNKEVRVRFAPSPTGFVHVGSLRTALFNYLFARKTGGTMVVRVEDTDRKRYVHGATPAMIRSLRWAGIEWDEGPYLEHVPDDGDGDPGDVIRQRGEHGPYVQSERRALYARYAGQLVEAGHAYRCFCSPERLERLRNEQEAHKLPPRYDGRCRTLSQEDVAANLERGVPSVVRLKVPEVGMTCFVDLVRGRLEFENATIDDQVLIKADGFPTYHLAVVVDDHAMGITHVIRGEEWLPSTPKHVLLYQALGWDLPSFAHLPLLVNAKKQKLSKRHGDVAVEDYVEQGYLPQALVNYVALLGWNPGGDQEIMSMAQMRKSFDLVEINKKAAVFDRDKLDWMNGVYIRQTDDAALARLVRPFLSGHVDVSTLSNDTLQGAVGLAKDRMVTLSDIWDLTRFVFQAPEYDPDLLVWKKSDMAGARDSLQFARTVISAMDQGRFSQESLEKAILSEIKKHERRNGDVLWPLRVALTGLAKSPGPFEVMAVLGKGTSLERIDAALERLA